MLGFLIISAFVGWVLQITVAAFMEILHNSLLGFLFFFLQVPANLVLSEENAVQKEEGEEGGKGQGQQSSAHLEDISATLRVLDAWERDKRGCGTRKKMRADQQGQRETESPHAGF